MMNRIGVNLIMGRKDVDKTSIQSFTAVSQYTVSQYTVIAWLFIIILLQYQQQKFTLYNITVLITKISQCK